MAVVRRVIRKDTQRHLIVACAPSDDRQHHVFHITRGKPRRVLRSSLIRRVSVGGTQAGTRDLITGTNLESFPTILTIWNVQIENILCG